MNVISVLQHFCVIFFKIFLKITVVGFDGNGNMSKKGIIRRSKASGFTNGFGQTVEI